MSDTGDVCVGFWGEAGQCLVEYGSVQQFLASGEMVLPGREWPCGVLVDLASTV